MIHDPNATVPIRWDNNKMLVKNPNIEIKMLGQVSLESAHSVPELFTNPAEGFYPLVLRNAYLPLNILCIS